MKNALFLAAALLVACGGSSVAPEPEPVASTSGGEAEPEPVLRTTTPVPVPQPAVAREAMSEPLQQLWTQIEETVSVRPPDPPAEATTEAIQAWAQGPFREWLVARREATSRAAAASRDVPEDPVHERAIAAALLAYALEDMVADVRGAPVPDDIANDPELLEIYANSLSEVLRPLASEAVVAYAFCQQRFASLGDESEWLPWRAYCVQRGREVIEVYELTPEGAVPPSDEPSEGDAETATESDEPI